MELKWFNLMRIASLIVSALLWTHRVPAMPDPEIPFLSIHPGGILGDKFLIYGFPGTVGVLKDSSGFQDWGGYALSDWKLASKATLLTDMTQSAPASAFSDKLKKGSWKVMSYEMRNTPPGGSPDHKGEGYKGKMIWAGPDTEAPEIRLPLKKSGWYAIFIGVYTGCNIWLKLDTDPAPVIRDNSIRDYYANSQEVFFKVAKLMPTSSLLISQQSVGYTSSSGITHVKLVPLTPGEIKQEIARRADKSHHTMAFSCDGFSFIYGRSPRTAEALLAELEPFRNTDYGTLLLHSTWGGDKVAYPSKIGYMPGQNMDAYTEIGHRYFADAVRELAQKGINPVKVLIDGAHQMGMKVHAGMRPAGWSFLEPYADFWETSFFRNHPMWQCRDKDGTPVTRMSWAVPEVRQHALDLLREQVAFGADGAHLVFNRGYPLMLYETPFRNLFTQQYGFDPITLEDSDQRIVRMRSEVVTGFFRELRAMLNREEKRRGNGIHLEISVCVLGTEPDNLQYGVDIRRLVKEGLLDEIYIYPYDFGATRKGGFDLAFFREVCVAKGIPFYPALATHWDLNKQIDQGLSFLDEGAAGVFVWDGGGQGFNWQTIHSRFGHPDEIRKRKEKLDFNRPPRIMYYFHKLGNKIYDSRFPPVWGG